MTSSEGAAVEAFQARGQDLDDPFRLTSLSLSGLMDVRSDGVLDRVVEVAARAIGAPVVLVSLVDASRQHFPSQIGLGEPWATLAETPLSHSFCQHVVRSGSPLIIADARQSELVRNNLAVSDLGVRSYAGFPLTDATGNVLGSFCVIDTEPREWTDAELATVADLGQLAQSEIRSRIALARSAARLGLLADVTAGLQGPRTVEAAVRAVCDRVVPAFCDVCLVDLMEIDGGFRLAAIAAAEAGAAAAVEEAETVVPRQQNPNSVVRRVLETGRSELHTELGDAFWEQYLSDPTERRAYQRLGWRSAVAVPMRAGSRIVGAVTLVRLDRSAEFQPADLHLAEEIGVRLGAAFDHAQAFQRDHDVAVALQSRLLSPPPDIADLDIAVRYRPSNRAAEVGGDWYDVMELGEGTGLAVGDVAGHDLDAAASMGQVQTALRAYALEALPPSDALDRVCQLMRRYSGEETVTAFFGILGPRQDDGSRTFTHSRAGHPPAILLLPGQPPQRLEDGLGPMIGIETDARRSAALTLPLGTTVVLYTDGLVEHRGRPVSTGLDEMVEALVDLPDRSAGAVAEYLLVVMRPEQGWDDDVALLVVTLR